MKSIRRSVAVLIATVFAVFGSNTPAFAGPVPITESEQGSGSVTPASTSGGILDGWLQVSVSVLIVAALVAIGFAAVSRMRLRVLTHA